MIELVILLVLALASYRLTRLLVIDTIFESQRTAIHNWLINKGNFLTDWLHDLLSCTWCAGVWVSATVYGLYTANWPWQYGRLGWLSVAALAGAQGLLHAFEPDDA